VDPAAAAAHPNKSVDMDWDDDEESTHVFDGKMPGDGGPPTAGPRPAAGMPAVGAAAALLAGSSVRPAPLPPPPGAMPHSSGMPMPGSVPMPSAVPLPSQVPMMHGHPGQTLASPSMPLPSMPPMSGPGPQTARSEATAVRNIPDLLGGMPQQQQQQSSGGSKVGIIFSALALVVVAGLAIFMFMPKKGTLKIDLQAKGGGTVDKAEIFVDGQKKCDITPCIVADLDPGSRTIKVIVPNAGPVDPVTVTVEAGKELPVMIPIDSGAGASPKTPPVAAKTSTGLKILAATPNTKVFLDGTDKGSLPADFSDVKPGSHKLRFDAGDRYERLDQSVDVEDGKVKEIGPIKLKVLKGQIILDLATEGAEVKLINAKKVEKKIPEKEWKTQPVKIDLDPTEGWKLVATKKGMDDFTRDLAFDDGNAEKQIHIDLANPKAAGSDSASGSATGTASGSISDSGSTASTGTTSTGGTSTPPTGPTSTTSTTPTAATTSTSTDKAPAATGTGTLNINSIPVSKVVLDGRPVGSTPKVGVSVPAGTHTVVFIHPEKGKKSVSVTVKAGETKTAAVKF
jgi:serine/threonine-protein kinase